MDKRLYTPAYNNLSASGMKRCVSPWGDRIRFALLDIYLTDNSRGKRLRRLEKFQIHSHFWRVMFLFGVASPRSIGHDGGLGAAIDLDCNA